MRKKTRNNKLVREAPQSRFDKMYHRKLRSPCLICSRRPDIPRCLKGCKTLECFQQMLLRVSDDKPAVDSNGDNYTIIFDRD